MHWVNEKLSIRITVKVISNAWNTSVTWCNVKHYLFVIKILFILKNVDTLDFLLKNIYSFDGFTWVHRWAPLLVV